MARTGITFEEVKKAIAELQGRQKNPTVDAIREVLGTGSKSTIARYLREWKAHHGLSADQDGRLPADLLGIVNGLWDALQHKADEQTDRYRQEYEAEAALLQQQLVQIRQQETSLKQALHLSEEHCHQQKEDIQQLSAKLIAETQEKIRQTERVAILESCRQENVKENQRLHQLLKHVQENLEHYQAAIQQLRQEQSLIIEKQQNDYEQRLVQMGTQLNQAIGEKAALQAQHEQLSITHAALAEEHKTLLARHTEIHSQWDLLRAQHDQLQRDYGNLNEKQIAQAAHITTQQQTLIEFQLTIKTNNEKITLTEALLAKANDKIEVLRQDMQFALQEKANLEGQLTQMQLMLTANKLSSDEAIAV